MNKSKPIIIIVLLSLTLIASLATPRAQYVGTGFISKLNLPLSINNWDGRDMTNTLNLDFDKSWNKFISEVMIYEYINKAGNRLNFILLDAGNFHHPNVCFTASGYEITELKDTEFNIAGRSFTAHTLFTQKENESNLSFYWIIIDKEIVHSWITQKIKQLYFSLFNRERVGLMVRIDIPLTGDNTDEAILLAKEFINDISQNMQPKNVDYIFGSR